MYCRRSVLRPADGRRWPSRCGAFAVLAHGLLTAAAKRKRNDMLPLRGQDVLSMPGHGNSLPGSIFPDRLFLGLDGLYFGHPKAVQIAVGVNGDRLVIPEQEGNVGFFAGL